MLKTCDPPWGRIFSTTVFGGDSLAPIFGGGIVTGVIGSKGGGGWESIPNAFRVESIILFIPSFTSSLK
jgi:hypothetical protein